METRKLQVSGHSTFILSLPKSWIQDNKIVKGDKVNLKLQPEGTILLIPPRTEKGLREISVTVDSCGDSIFRKFMGLYFAGYQVMEFKLGFNCTKEDMRYLKRTIQKIKGIEVLNETNDTLIVQDLFDSSLFSPDRAIRRMTLIAKTMVGGAIGSLGQSIAELSLKDDDLDMICWLITRQYNMILQDITLSDKLKVSSQKGLSYLMIAKSLERIGDHAMKIASIESTAGLEKRMTSDGTKELTENMLSSIDRAMTSFFQKDFDMANEVIESLESINNEILMKLESALGGKKGADMLSYALLLDSLRCICTYSIDIAETAMDSTFLDE